MPDAKPIVRRFLGWERPLLHAAIDETIARFGVGGELDLSRVAFVTPGGRAGRRLLELLVERAERDGLRLSPPDCRTPGRLTELLFAPPLPLANATERTLAWQRVLRAAERERLRLLAATLPAADEVAGWATLAETLDGLATDVASELHDFAAVAERLSGEAFVDPRWSLLAELQGAYHEELAIQGLLDLQEFRRRSLDPDAAAPCRFTGTLILLATTDLTGVLRAVLRKAATHCAEVAAWIFAPESEAAGFDEVGAVVPEHWAEHAATPVDGQLAVADGPADQADRVLLHLADLDGAYRADEITVGVTDAVEQQFLVDGLRRCDIPVRAIEGRDAADTGPPRLLAALADLLDGGELEDLATLLRHPQLDRYLTGWHRLQGHPPTDWLARLAEHQAKHLQVRLTGKWRGVEENREPLERMLAALRDLVAPLLPESEDEAWPTGGAAKRRLDEWATPLADLLAAAYGERPLLADDPADRLTLAGCEAVAAVLRQLTTLPEVWCPPVTAAQAIRWVLRQAAGTTIAPEADESAVELLGWLELALDDAPVLVVTGFCEGRIPASIVGDQFLPDASRRRLGLLDDRRRLARDACALTAILQSRPHVLCVVPRRSAEGDSLMPSRLLFGPRQRFGDTLRRVRRLFDPSRRRRLACVLRGPEPAPTVEPTNLHALPPADPDVPLPTAMRVTEFRDYLASPYHYWLRHVRRLKAAPDRAEEMDALGFGGLIHDVLADFAAGELRGSDQAGAIAAFLADRLATRVRRLHGRGALPAVAVQVEQIRLRLAAFAHWQADWRRQGWTIRYAEEADDAVHDRVGSLDTPAGAVELRGRIDRIDSREGETVVFDYKTSSAGDGPDKTHRSGDRWKDLQLPLYRHLLHDHEAACATLRFGYVVLPKKTGDTGARLAKWTEDDLAHADAAARAVVVGIRSGHFPVGEHRTDGFFDDYAWLCREHLRTADE